MPFRIEMENENSFVEQVNRIDSRYRTKISELLVSGTGELIGLPNSMGDTLFSFYIHTSLYLHIFTACTRP